mmetsp:Transcript_2648/g.10093  ORF Transcript_2648/g.10093 Transcript_2648/m.10093 type:complete len:2307 (+) Transcript_2648:267-7187(+)
MGESFHPLFSFFLIFLFVSHLHSINYSPKRLWSSGDNTYGTLGINDNTTKYVSSPQPVLLTGELTGKAIVDVSVGYGQHALLLTSDGSVFSSGLNYWGQLGVGDFTNRFVFTPVRQENDNATQICVMTESSMYLTDNHEIKSWGRNQYGQLGVGDGLRKDGSAPSRNVPSSVFLGGALRNKAIKKLVCASHTVFVLTDGGLFGWGRNDFFQLGTGNQVNQYLPSLILPFELSEVVLGQNEAYALSADGKLYAWGRGWEGQMGVGSQVNHIVPREIPFFFGKTISRIAAGSGYVMIVSQDSLDGSQQVYAFGNNARSQLSLGAALRGDVTLPQASNITVLGSKRIIGLMGNSYRSVLVAQDGEIFWSGETHRFGDPPTNSMVLDSFVPFHDESNFFQSNVTVHAGDFATFYLESFTCGDYLDTDPFACSQHGVCTTNENYCACDAGYSNQYGQSSSDDRCIICPSGFYWSPSGDRRNTDCLPCPVATYSTVEGATSGDYCISCPPGSITEGIGKNSSDFCIPCDPGFYAFIQNGVAICAPCQPGTYSSASAQTSSETCSACPAGTFSNTLGAADITSCNMCPEGTYSVTPGATNSSFCINCAPGTFSATSGANSPSVCSDCPLGFYSGIFGASNCSQCPRGSVTSSSGSQSIGDCDPCPPGRYASDTIQLSQSQCLPCVRGSYTNETSSTECIFCPPGYITLSDESTQESDCKSCPEGTYTTDGMSCTECSPGTFSTVKGASVSHTCTLCPAGSWSSVSGANSSLACEPCEIGTYSPVLGATSPSTCQNCPPDTFSLLGASSCVACPIGSQSVLNENNVTTCIPCQRGEYISTFNGSTTCPPCPYATYSDLDSQLFCKPCPLGSVTNTTGAESISYCNPCEAGTYAVVNADFAYCEECPIGTFSESIGAHNISTCLDCPGGTYRDSIGGSSNNSCSLCPSGTFSIMEGATSVDDCNPCPTESYSHAGSTQCIPCPPGTVTDGSGKTSETDCLPCFVGTYSQVVNNTAVCVPCDEGTYSETPLATSPDSCLPCPPGKYNNRTGADTQNACLSCPAGRYQPEYRATSYQQCLSCPVGSYVTSPASVQCTRCPSGHSTTGTGKTSIGDCLKCPLGTFSVPTTTGPYAFIEQVCLSCDAGSYSTVLGASSNATCDYCPAGTWSNTTGATSISDCTPCGLGLFSSMLGATSVDDCEKCPQKTYADELGSSSCKSCPFGTIPEGAGQTSISQCQTCGSGKYLGEVNSTFVCVDCPAGYFSSNPAAVNESTCTPCARGTYNPSPGAPSDASCLPCPRGTFNPYTAASSLSMCVPCPSETYADLEGSWTCSNCPNGTVTCTGDSPWPSCVNSIGNTDISKCLECRDGSYFSVLESGRRTCVRCPLGYFSSKTDSLSNYCGYASSGVAFGTEHCSRESPHYNIGIDSCLACGFGFYFRTPTTSNWLASSKSSVCNPCPASLYSNQTAAIGESQCQSCPAGTYAGPGSAVCHNCPAGTHSTKPAGDRTSSSDCVPCPKGYYSGEQASVCVPCPRGTWSDAVAAQNGIACTACEPGSFSTVLAATSADTCLLCDVGEFTSNFSSTKCVACEAGTSNAQKGQTSCIVCAPGFYAYEMSEECLPCPPGTANAVDGATSVDFCLPCAENTYAPSMNHTSCLDCGVGYNCPFGSSARIASTAFSNYFQKSVVDITKIVARTEELAQSGEIVKSTLIPLFCVGLLLLFLVTTIVGCVREGRKNPFKYFAYYDLLFNMYHPALYGKPRIKKRNKLGGMFSILAVSSCFILFLLQTSDVWLDNIQISESFQMVVPKGAEEGGDQDITEGLYNASVSLFGEFEVCSTDSSLENAIVIESRGFVGVSEDDGQIQPQKKFCERRQKWTDLQSGEAHDIPNCYCEWTCPRCTLDGIAQAIEVFAPNAHTPSIFFELGVPHYLRDPETGHRKQFKIDGNALASSQNVFFGPQDQPVNLFFSIFQSKYLESPNVLIAIFNNTKDESTGVTSQLLSVSNVGASSSSERIKQLRSSGSNAGVSVRYNFDVSKFVFITEEEPKMTALSYVAQLAALFGAVMSVLKALLNGIEMSKKKIKKHWKRFLERIRPKPKAIPNPLEHRLEGDTKEPVRENMIHEVDPWHYLGGEIKNNLGDDENPDPIDVNDVNVEEPKGKLRLQLPKLAGLRERMGGLTPRHLAASIAAVTSPRGNKSSNPPQAATDQGQTAATTPVSPRFPAQANNYIFSEHGAPAAPPKAARENNLIEDFETASLTDDDAEETDVSLDAISTPTEHSFETSTNQSINPLAYVGWNSKNMTGFFGNHDTDRPDDDFL